MPQRVPSGSGPAVCRGGPFIRVPSPAALAPLPASPAPWDTFMNLSLHLDAGFTADSGGGQRMEGKSQLFTGAEQAASKDVRDSEEHLLQAGL